MKISKDALRTARQLMRLTLRNGTLDTAAAKTIVDKFVAEKPRNYIATLTAYQRLIRLELAKRHAIIESAQEMNEGDRSSVLSDLQRKHGTDITADFRTVPSLIGGIRVQLGSTVWDGSVKSRLEALRSKVTA